MTKREIIYSVFEKLKIRSDDSDISGEYVSTLIDTARSMAIKQIYGPKPWNIPIETKQELCLSLETVKSIDGLETFGTISRTTVRLPKGISIKGGESVLAVKLYDKISIPINIVPIERIPFVLESPIPNMMYAAMGVDRRVYIVGGIESHKMLGAIKVDGIYESPDEAQAYQCRDFNLNVNAKSKSGDSVYVMESPAAEPWDEEYPLELAIVENIINDISSKLAQTIQLPEDDLNNANDDRQ